jgi:hypothetical protein
VRSVDSDGRVLGDRFELLAPLGAGAMGDVYRARDRRRGQDVALKVLPELEATALLRFKNEFRALHDVEHPNLVRLHELHEDHGTWFFTMQLVDGVDVLTWIGRDLARARIVLPQVAQALYRLHGEGLVHRDVKPSNVLVTCDGKAMLLDFGLVAPSWSPGEGAGTPAFMAPEQETGDISPAADWYAFGVLMFRVLTGRLPFTGSAPEIARAKCERPAPRVRAIASDAPADLAALTDALLERRAGARPRGAAVLTALGTGATPMQVAHGLVVGRDRELATLRQAVVDRMAGDPIVVAVLGGSGIGKTALLHELAQELAINGTAWVLSGRCWERESVPYKGFDGVIDELAARLEADDWELADAGWNALLAQAFPVLRRVRGFRERAQVGDLRGHETAARLSSGMRWLFSAVAARQPLVLLIDDLQWADRDTLSLLRALFVPAVPNVLLGYAARERISFDDQPNVRTLTLEPLSELDTTRLIELVARELGGRVDAATIAREAGGHPLFARELARYLVTTGETGPTSFEEVARRLVDRFGEEPRRIATIISLAHVPLSIDATAHAAGASGPPFFDAITQLRNAQLVATSGVGGETRLEPYHDRIRRTLLERLSPSQLTELHARIAESLAATGSEEHAALALHWERAGHLKTAARHALHAAEQAEAALAFHRASHFYTWVLALDPTPETRLKHAEALAQAGLGVDAAAAFLACARETHVECEALDIRRRAMQQLLLMGHNDRALVLLDDLMRALDLPNPTTPARQLVRLIASRAAIRLHRPTLPPISHAQLPPLERVRLDVLWDAATGLAFVDPLRAYYLHSLNLRLCFHRSDGSRLARGLLGEAPYLATSGKRTRRLATCLKLADEAATRASFPAVPLLARGSIAFLFGEWRECRDLLAECERLLHQDRPRLVKEGLGPAQLQDLTRRLQLAAMFYLGDLKSLRLRVAELLQDSIERNDVTSATHLRSGVMASMYLAFDGLETAARAAEQGFRPWRTSTVGVPHFMDLQARTVIGIYAGRARQAYRDVLAEWRGFVRSGLMRVQYVEVSLLDARGRAALAAALVGSARERRHALVDAARCADRLQRTNAAWAIALAAALRAGIALAGRDHVAAIRHLVRAAASADAARMALHATNARMIQALLAGDREVAAAERRTLADAGIVDIDRYSYSLLPRG